jgi:hypothetical protein
MDPSPTKLRRVSGIRLDVPSVSQSTRAHQSAATHKTMGRRTTAVRMVRNQKIDLQPSVSVRRPPRNGPKAGPIIEPDWKIAINLPRSLGSATSDTQPAPMDMTAEPPVLYSSRQPVAQTPAHEFPQTCKILSNRRRP